MTRLRLNVILCTLLACVSMQAKELILAQDGKTDYVIVQGLETMQYCHYMQHLFMKDCATDFASLLKQSTGADFPIVKPKEAQKHGKRIFLGHTKVMVDLLTKAGKYRKPKNEERILQTVGDDLFLYGGGYADEFAMYHFLKNTLGFRFYHYWGDSHIPTFKTLKIKDMDIAFMPAFEYRDLRQATFNYAGCKTGADFFRRNMLHNNSRMPFTMPGDMTHSYSRLIPPTKNFPSAYPFLKDREYFVTNPDFFPLGPDGKRSWQGKHRCFSNPKLRNEMNKNVELLLKSRKCKPNQDIVVNISHDDTDCKFCYCPACVALEKQYGAPGGPLYDYLVKSASPYFAKRYPNLIIRFLAYGRLSTEIPPKPEALPGGKLPANLMPYLAFLTADFNKPMNAPSNKFIFDCFANWGKVSQRMCSYYYPATYPRPMISFPLFGNAGRVISDIQFLGQHNLKQIFHDYASLGRNCNTAFSGLISYVVSQLYDNPNLDTNKAIDEFMGAVYGPAAKLMRQYYDELHEQAFKDPTFVSWYPDPRVVKYLTTARLLSWQRLYDRMEQVAAKAPRALLHIRCERLTLDAMTMLLYRDFRRKGMQKLLPVEPIYQRALWTGQQIMEHAYNQDFKNHITPEIRAYVIQHARESIFNTLGLFHGLATLDDKLPKEFGNIPESDRFYTVFSACKLPQVKLEDSPLGYVLPAPLPGDRVTGYDFVRGKGDGPNGRRLTVTTGNGKFQYHYLTRSKLSPTSVMGAPHRRAFRNNVDGAMGGYALGFLGFIFDPQNPDQEYDFYVCMKFGKKEMYTSHLLLVKAKPGRKPCLARKSMGQEVESRSIVPTVPEHAGQFPPVSQLGKLGSFLQALNGLPEKNSINAYAGFGKDRLYLQITEDKPIVAPKGKDAYEIFLAANGSYPLTHIIVKPDGSVTCKNWTIPVTANPDDKSVQRIPTAYQLPGSIKASQNAQVWNISLNLDLKPFSKDGNSLVMNIFRIRTGKGILSWSPIHTWEPLDGFQLSGILHRDKLVFKGPNVVTATKFIGDVATMDGNNGWAISCELPRGLDPNANYRLTAMLRTDATTTNPKHTTRIGTYDQNRMLVIGYRQIPVKDLATPDFTAVKTGNTFKAPSGTLMYIGGFIPSKTFTGTMYLKEFILTREP